MPSTTHEKLRGLVFPWGAKAAPTEPLQVADGVWWLRFPMPGALDHINLWLLEDGDGWTLVDTCLDVPEARARWEGLFSGFMGGKPLRRVICTHLHPDHIGLAGWLTRRFDCDLWVSREEFLMCHTLADYTGQPAPDVAIRFYRAAGYDEQMLDTYRSRFGSFGSRISALPDSFRRLVDGETIEIGDRYWQVIVGSGHSPEHVSLYCPGLKLLISGDQVLPRITPNVSVFPTEPKGDPLKEWLNSCESIRARLPDTVLVLPGHLAPFLGLHVRLTQIIESHERALVTLFDALAEPRRAVDCARVMFRRELTNEILVMATGETLAHLNCLVGRRMVRRERDADGVDWYTQKPDTVDFTM
ncbi:MAG: MBL fold metallo-hydrolase [Pseudomonadales bacterium]|jgi:glyoxylase-like metal-dependent hydrolase (beta-lactamase superfamily II)|nr:MBL fold metallo-hydrolase [Pseudomonadales bacterium]MCP5337272.1 MBL fold metallo-hydrolase [Pseudomonadales bacterium]